MRRQAGPPLAAVLAAVLVLGTGDLILGAQQLCQQGESGCEGEAQKLQTESLAAQGRQLQQVKKPGAGNTSHTAPWVYVHIPKTAGTTVTEWLKARLRSHCKEINMDDQNSLQAAVALSLKFQPSITPGTTLVTAGAPCHFVHLLAGPDGDQRSKFFHAVPQTGLRTRYIMGHVPFGYCLLAEPGCRYITVMREPRERLYSHYQFLKRNHPAYLRDFTCLEPCETFPDFVRLLSQGKLREPGLENMQTRMIAGMSFWSTTGSGMCASQLHGCDDVLWIEPKTLKVAKRNLAFHFAVVGTLDNLEGFRQEMVQRYGMDNVPLPDPMNTMGKNEPWKPELDMDQKHIAMLNATQALDMELYAFAKQLIKRRLQRRQQGQSKRVGGTQGGLA